MAVDRSSGGWRDEAAATLLAREVPSLSLPGPALVVEDPREEVALALGACGVDVQRWDRRASAGRAATPWPQEGPFGSVIVRLPRARDELEMTLHAALSVLRADGRLLLYGARDEGVISAAGRMEPLVGEVRTVATGGRCRVLDARRPERVPGLRASLREWRETSSLVLPELTVPWVSYPGVFAHGRLDEGTRLLLATLPMIPPEARVLDFGCGSGVVGAVVLARNPEGSVDFLDVDAVALEAVRINVPGARTVLADGLEAVSGERYDLIASNPPYHEGKAESLDVLEELVEKAPGVLSTQGELVLVAQRRLPLERMLRGRFRRVEAVADDGRIHRVWRASGGGSGR